jgi:hypothetical protein
VVVPVALVRRVAVPVVQIVDVALVGDGHVTTALTVDVRVVLVLDMALRDALVDVALVDDMQVPVVHVVDVALVRDGHVTTALAVDVGVVGMLNMGGAHGCSSFGCSSWA